jgi:Protein of unknown function (DUF4238)
VTDPRRHHYVPQFHQRRFVGSDHRLWVWDKSIDRVFQTTPGSIAVEADFYRLHDFEELGYDPLVMEKQLSEMEGQMSLITEQWLDWLRTIDPGQRIEIPPPNRDIVARFMAVQFLRTADTRDILNSLHSVDNPHKPLSKNQLTGMHTALMWDRATVDKIAGLIREAIWIFARNTTPTPFVTSDNPVAFRTKDDAMWLKARFVAEGTYAVYPLAPDIVMYCYERTYWKKIDALNGCLSPVSLSDKMVESENSGQVFMAGRFVISPINDFAFVREFANTIGTDTYARYGDELPQDLE